VRLQTASARSLTKGYASETAVPVVLPSCSRFARGPRAFAFSESLVCQGEVSSYLAELAPLRLFSPLSFCPEYLNAWSRRIWQK